MILFVRADLVIKLIHIDSPGITFLKSLVFTSSNRTISTVHIPDNSNNSIRICSVNSIILYSVILTSPREDLITSNSVTFFIFPMVKDVSSTISMVLFVRIDLVIKLRLFNSPGITFLKNIGLISTNRTITTIHIPNNSNITVRISIINSIIVHSIVFTSPIKGIRRSNNLTILIYPMTKDISHTISMVLIMACNLTIKLILINNPSGTFVKGLILSGVDRTSSTIHMPNNSNNTIKILIIYSIIVYCYILTSIFKFLIRIYNITIFIFPMIKFVSSTISMEFFIWFNSVIEFSHGKSLGITIGKVR